MATSARKGSTAHDLEAEKRWTERLILAQSPLWIIPAAYVMISGVILRWNDADYIAFAITVALPAMLVPALLSKPSNRPWYRRYWVKLNIWIAIIVSFGTYFISHYYFDLMGMRYEFNSEWNFSSDVVGRTGGQVPVFMYPLTHACFMTYYTILLVAERVIIERLQPGRIGRLIVLVVLSYSAAFGETFFMATPLLSEVFSYADRDRMLKFGSIGYAAYFLGGVPMLKRIDSHGEDWTLSRVVIEAFAAFMGILVLFETWAKLAGPL
ncbi:hypothetical protein FSARC_13734 [Fusarium sarcochroum]|uniref:Cycloeucalenol cycloisomerase n=1 Tax=Fusarium sarcochroum TaxID=1208366 RepID=A0A8H4WSB3_9HYPO|nr:hypothetical protein FSARC_13734 [Fusarium sarcochroum]